jgi:hypothetical protein
MSNDESPSPRALPGERFLAILATDESQYALYGKCVETDDGLFIEMDRGGRLPLDEPALGRVHAVTADDRTTPELASLLTGVAYMVSYSMGVLNKGEGQDFAATGVNIADLG